MFLRKRTSFREEDFDSLIKACIAQDQQAQKTLIRLFYGYAKSIGLRYAGNAQEAEEIISDSFLKVFNSLARYDASFQFKGWLRAIIVNTAIDYYRRNQKNVVVSQLDEIDIQDLNEDVIGKISADEILLLVQKLSPAYRMVFTLYVIDGYNHREIAELIGIKEGTSKSNLQDARKKLQEMIRRNYPELYHAHALKTRIIDED